MHVWLIDCEFCKGYIPAVYSFFRTGSQLLYPDTNCISRGQLNLNCLIVETMRLSFLLIFGKWSALTASNSILSLMTRQLYIYLGEGALSWFIFTAATLILVIGNLFSFLICNNYHRRIMRSIHTSIRFNEEGLYSHMEMETTKKLTWKTNSHGCICYRRIPQMVF